MNYYSKMDVDQASTTELPDMVGIFVFPAWQVSPKEVEHFGKNDWKRKADELSSGL